MSINQCDFYVVTVANGRMLEEQQLSWDACEPYLGLETSAVKAAFETFVAPLPRLQSWSSDIRWFGDKDGNRVDLCDRGDGTVEILIRFDSSKPDHSFIACTARFCDAVEGILLAGDATVLEPAEPKIVLHLQNAWATRVKAIAKLRQ